MKLLSGLCGTTIHTLSSTELIARCRQLVVAIHLDTASSHGIVGLLVVPRPTSSSHPASASSDLKTKSSHWARTAPRANIRPRSRGNFQGNAKSVAVHATKLWNVSISPNSQIPEATNPNASTSRLRLSHKTRKTSERATRKTSCEIWH